MSATACNPCGSVWQRRGQFTAHNSLGRPVSVYVYAAAGGPPTLLTADGDLVHDHGGGSYEVADTGEALRVSVP
jgi:hypothetical protein